MTDSRAALAGVWLLVAWELVAPDAAPASAFGPNPRGLLTYTADGWMSVVISAGERPALPADPRDRAQADKARAFDSVHAYAGTYSLLPGAIIHHVQVSAIPNYEGTDQRRQMDLRGDTLVLSTPPGQAAHLAPGSAVAGRLTWRRVTASD